MISREDYSPHYIKKTNLSKISQRCLSIAAKNKIANSAILNISINYACYPSSNFL